MTLAATLAIYSAFFFPNLTKLSKGGPFFGDSLKYFREVFWSSMNAHEKSKVERGDLIDFLVKLKNETQDSAFSKFV